MRRRERVTTMIGDQHFASYEKGYTPARGKACEVKPEAGDQSPTAQPRTKGKGTGTYLA